MNIKNRTAITINPISAIHANIFHNKERGESLTKNLVIIVIIIKIIMIIGITLILHLLRKLEIIISELYRSDVLDIISKLSGIAIAITNASNAAMSDKKSGFGVYRKRGDNSSLKIKHNSIPKERPNTKHKI